MKKYLLKLIDADIADNVKRLMLWNNSASKYPHEKYYLMKANACRKKIESAKKYRAKIELMKRSN